MRNVEYSVENAGGLQALVTRLENEKPLALLPEWGPLEDGAAVLVDFRVVSARRALAVVGRVEARDGARGIAFTAGESVRLRDFAAELDSTMRSAAHPRDAAPDASPAGASAPPGSTEVMHLPQMRDSAAASGDAGPTEVMARPVLPAPTLHAGYARVAPRGDLGEAPTSPVAFAPHVPPPPKPAYDPMSPKTLVGHSVGGGKYRIESLIGVGSMGAVYRARHVQLDKAVAVKVMLGAIAERPDLAARFQREAKTASLFDHPNSVRVSDFGQDDNGLCYIAMELVEGRDLEQVVSSEGPLDSVRAASIIVDVLGTLARAHDAGIVHRDVKPENILLLAQKDDEGNAYDQVKVCDFGIAKIRDDQVAASASEGATQLTARGLIIGTPEFMSPEQAQGESVDFRSDIYSCGIVLYYMLTGELPFQGETAVKVIIGHVTRTADPPSTKNPNIDPRFDAICMKAMAKRVADRYQTARDMRRDVRAVLTGASSGARGSLVSVPDLARATGFLSSGQTPAVAAATGARRTPTAAPAQTRGARAILFGAVAACLVGGGLLVAAFAPPLGRRESRASTTPTEAPAPKVELTVSPTTTSPLPAGEGRSFIGVEADASRRVAVDGQERRDAQSE